MELSIVQRLVIFFGPFLFALCFHEFSHGLVAKWRGDNTAEKMGRLTLNPLAHADLIGTVIFPIASILLNLPFSFGWAKPVPVDSRNLKNVRTDMFWIALAGPASNILLAVIATFLFGLIIKMNLFVSFQPGIIELMKSFIVLNLFLAFFNLIPLYPLDGSKVLARFLPASLNYKIEQHEQISNMILFILLLSGLISFLRYPVILMYNFLINLVF